MAIPRETVFPTDEFDTRLHNTRKVMESRQIDVLILHSAPNIYYLCGHQSLNLWDCQCLIAPPVPDLRSGELLWDSMKIIAMPALRVSGRNSVFTTNC